MIINAFVGLDCLALPRQFSGAANYIFALTRELLVSPERRFPIALFCKTIHKPLFHPFLRREDKLINVSLRNRAAQLYFYEARLKNILLKEDVKVFYATHYMCPPRHPSYRIINTFHDMGFLLYPGYYPVTKRLYFRRMMHRFVARSRQMVAVSRTTAADLARLFPARAGEISVIYPGTDHLSPAPVKSTGAIEEYEPYLLAVNTFELRKQIPFLISAFTEFKQQFQTQHKFLITGHPANATRLVHKAWNASPFRNDIQILPSVSEAELRRLYNNCSLFLNASVYEGFGFTPFEAMHFQKPMLLYGNAVIREILGEQSFILPHLIPEIWAEHIHRQITDSDFKISGKEILFSMTWQKAARLHLRMLDVSLTVGAPKIVS